MSMKWTTDDIKACNTIAQASVDGMRSAALMAVLSIQQSWHTVPEAMVDVTENGSSSRFLWGFKRDTYLHLIQGRNMDHLYAQTIVETDPVRLLDLWTTVPGLGLAKAGFVCQLTRGIIGCVDGHNAAAYDVPPSALVFPKGRMTTKAQAIKLRNYVTLCADIGGSEYMWQQWCVLMAAKYPETYHSAKAVSEQHVNIMEAATI